MNDLAVIFGLRNKAGYHNRGYDLMKEVRKGEYIIRISRRLSFCNQYRAERGMTNLESGHGSLKQAKTWLMVQFLNEIQKTEEYMGH